MAGGLTAQVSKTVNVTKAGNLISCLSSNELNTVTNLTITGYINACDFRIMRDYMPLLAVIDMSSATIQSYTGNQGTALGSSYVYSPKVIPDYAFCNPVKFVGKTSLTSISLPSSAIGIGEGAFSFCSGLTNISIPSNITTIFDGAFCASSASLSVDATNTNYSSQDGVLFNKDKSSLIHCPTNKIGSYYIPQTVTSIVGQSFYNCVGLNSISIPAAVKTIGSLTFYNCTGLTSIRAKNTLPIDLALVTSVFGNVDYSICKLYVPFSTKNTYQSSTQWKNFLNIEEMNGFILSENTVNIEAKNGSNKSISISSNASWTAISDRDWLKVSTSSGTGNATLTFTATASEGKRTARVCIKSIGIDTVTQTITVIQAGSINKDFYSQRMAICSANGAWNGGQSMAIDSEGNLWTWGLNTDGQLGDGTNINQSAPEQIESGTKFTTVSSGVAHSLAIDKDGYVWAWGANDYGELGSGTTLNTNVPQQYIKDFKFKIVSAGWNHSMAIDENGYLWVWGCNSEGQLGDGTTVNKYSPIQIKSDTKFKTISAGSSTSFAIDETGNLWAWGANIWGLLGDGTTVGKNQPIIIKPGTKFQSISSGYAKSLAIDQSGNLWNWGNGIGTSPVKIISATQFINVSAASFHCLAIDIAGNLWAWGDNINEGLLGDGSGLSQTNPVKINVGVKYKSISAAYEHSLAVDESGNIWAWGRNQSGQIGINSFPTKSSFVKIKPDIKFQAVSTGQHDFSFAIDNSGYLWAWGNNNGGSDIYGNISTFLGNGNSISQRLPIQIKSDTKFQTVSCGADHTLAIDESGNLWAWGDNSYGQIGDGSNVRKKIPVLIKSGTKFESVSAGNAFSLAIDESGNLWAWGYNDGQLGDGTSIDKNTPIQLMNGVKFKTISTANHSLAIDELDNLWTWGYNNYGELGDGTTAEKTTPIKINSTTKFKTISAGTYYSMAIDQSGNLWVCGANNVGQLGDGTTTNRLNFTQIKAGTKFQAIYASNNAYTGEQTHSLAIDELGNLWIWGYNRSGELGNGTTIDEHTPIQIMAGNKFQKIATGSNNSFAIDDQGILWACGLNNRGSLGDGTAWLDVPTWLNINNTATETPELHIESNNIKAYGIAGQIRIRTANASNYTIYNLMGIAIASGKLPAGDTTIAIKQGLYIFSAGGIATKIIVR